MSQPLISCLCVTENRPDFTPWLLWNWKRQTYPDTELVIVDASEKPFKTKTKGVRVVHAPGLNIPARRNLAVSEARGDFVAWFDDDDWYHPERLEVLSCLVTDECPIAGPKLAWFVNLFTFEAKRFVQRRGVLNSGLLARKQVLLDTVYDESLNKGSDLTWLTIARNKYQIAETFEVPSFFLCHNQNAGNTADVHQFNRPINEIINAVTCAWQDTTNELEALRGRVMERAS